MHPVTWIQRKSHRFGQGAHVDWGKIEQDPAGLVLTLKTWALYSVRCPGRRPLCLLCFPQDEPPEYHFPWRFFWSFHMMFSGSKVCPPELHINRTIRHWSEAKAGVLLNHLFFFLKLHCLQLHLLQDLESCMWILNRISQIQKHFWMLYLNV